MLIAISDGAIVVSGYDEHLRLNHVSQLKSWGYVQKDQELVVHEPVEGMVRKLIDYFDKRNIPYETTIEVNEIFHDLVEREKEHKNKLERLRDYKDGEFEHFDVEKHLNFLSSLPRKLKEHQIKASLHLYLAENAANFSVPGSGKTTVVLSVYERLRRESVVEALYVIGPLSSFGAWKEEFSLALGRQPKISVIAGGSKTARLGEYYNYEDHSELYLTSFQTNLADHVHAKKLLDKVPCMLVVDEAHYIKRLDGEWSDAVLDLVCNAQRRVVLTGTPMPKGYSDMFNLIDFLYPDHQYLNQKERSMLIDYQKTAKQENAKSLIEKSIGPLFYRVRKKELHLKKQNFFDPIKLEMNSYEKTIYEAIITKIINYSKNDYLINIELVDKLIRGRMMRLRQSASYVNLLTTAIDSYDEDVLLGDEKLASIIFNYDEYEKPAKLHALLELVNEHYGKGEKIIIWSNFIGTISLIEREITSKNIHCKKIIGETPVEKETVQLEDTRESIKNEFNDDQSGLNVLLANPAACAESISLHKSCSNAVYYDLSYNCAQYLQSLDRIHRVGASEYKETNYYYLQYRNTIDEDILASLISKSRRMREVIDDDYAIYDLDMFEISDEVEAYKRLFTHAK